MFGSFTVVDLYF